MKTILLQTMLVFLIMGTAFSQIENFEGYTHGATSFTVGGLNFTITGDLMVEVVSTWGCNETDGYLGSGTQDGGSVGSFGSIKVTNPGDKFKIVTSSAWCALASSNDGITQTSGDVKFIGTLTTGGTIEETLNVAPQGGGGLGPGWGEITFSSGIWDDQELTELEATIVAGMNYLALDNIAFETITTPVSIILEEAIKIYPNPAVGEIEIIGIDDLEVKVIDAFGRVVKEQSIFNQKIDVSELPNGIYYISMNAHNQQIIKRIAKH